MNCLIDIFEDPGYITLDTFPAMKVYNIQLWVGAVPLTDWDVVRIRDEFFHDMKEYYMPWIRKTFYKETNDELRKNKTEMQGGL